ncbi:MAG: hypothetical protein II931_03900 [Clostridia bacterium]|nr:hypothetical protein [Clostridia bacterium]
MNINEKVAYIRGLTDGLKLNENDDTVKVLKAVIDLLEDISDEVTQLGEFFDELSEQVEEIDQDLSIVEDDLYDSEEDDEDFDDFDEDGEYYEVVCPSCGDEICVSEDILIEGEIDCPKCGKRLEFDFSTLSADDINATDEE